jgi:NTP pyrophosphatase (non-canonical NTP hydrolase)
VEINQLVKDCHENAKAHGFWNDPREFGTTIALVHSELSEALEEMRVGNRIRPGQPTPMVYYSGGGYVASEPTECCKKPEGVAVELADAVIRIADLCGHLGIDLEKTIIEKMAYNETRPFKHGKKF